MKKRMLTMLLALVMIMCVLPFSAMAAEEACTHSAETYIEREEADCIHQGAINIFCKVCGKLKNSQTLPLASHTYKKSKCTVCGAVCSKHRYGPEVRVEATCEEDGSVTKTCTECGYKKTVKTLEAKGHEFKIYVSGLVATCTVDGYTPHKKCQRCGERNDDYKVIEAQGHELTTEEDVAATCTKDGVFTQKCENCEYVNTEIREHTGHTYADVEAKEPTCAEAGYKAHKACINCGKKKNYKSVPATEEHADVTMEAKAPTCVAAGHTAYQECTNCGRKTGYESIPATNSHTYVNGQCTDCGAAAPNYSAPSKPIKNCKHPSKSTYTTSPDCTVVGYVVVTCDTCHVEISREIIPATGHTLKSVKQDPTCTEDGFVMEICEVCNTPISGIAMEALGHNHVNGICTRCGGADPQKYTNDLQDVFIVG